MSAWMWFAAAWVAVVVLVLAVGLMTAAGAIDDDEDGAIDDDEDTDAGRSG